MINLNIPSPIQNLKHPLFDKHNVKVFVKRDDLIHPIISGNKWRKLKFNIEKYKQGGYQAILTFGGAYSNHIAATAQLGKELDISTIGIIRGDELNKNSNSTLKQANDNGMDLHFVTRNQYQFRYEKWYWEELRNQFGNILIIEEGGANFSGVLGCAEIIDELDFTPDYMISAAGTGTTITGLVYQSTQTKIIGVPVFKNGEFIKKEVSDLLYYTGLSDIDIEEKLDLLTLETRFHFGGYGKFTNELIDFMNDFYEQTNLKLDQVYTAKMAYSFLELLKNDFFPKDSTIVLLHTGGLQGIETIKGRLSY